MKNKVETKTELGTRGESARCVACKEVIPTNASVCYHCKSYQRPWKNHLQYGAGIATLLVLVLSGSIWLYSKARVTLFYHDDVRLISCNSLHSAVVANWGDGEVFLSHLLLYMPGRSSNWVARRLEFEETLPAGRFLRRDFPPAKIETAEFVRNIDSAGFNKLLVRASNGDACFELVFFDKEDNFLRELKQMAGPRLNTFNVAGYLEFWGLYRRAVTRVPIEGVGVLRRDSRPQCQ